MLDPEKFAFAYSADDFESDRPYKDLFNQKLDDFAEKAVLDALADYAKNLGVKNVKTMYAKYKTARHREEKAAAKNNVTPINDNVPPNPGSVKKLTNPPIDLAPGEYIIDDDGIHAWIGKNYETICTCPVLPVERHKDMVTGAESLVLAFRRNDSCDWEKIRVEKTTIANASQITSLANTGLPVYSANAKWLGKYILDIDIKNTRIIPQMKSISKLGRAGNEFSPYVTNAIYEGDPAYESIYNAIHSEGDYCKWKQAASECRRASMAGRVSLAASFASPLVRPLHMMPFFIHVWGRSDTGKTVAMQVAASVWADPDVGAYIKNFDSTAVGQEMLAGYLNEFPLILDESQTMKNKGKAGDLNIYKLTKGEGRIRGSKSGGVREMTTWRNTILTTGETPLTSANDGAGAMNRIIEVEVDSRAGVIPLNRCGFIADTVSNNFGFAGEKFVSKLYGSAKTLDSIQDHFKELKEKMNDFGIDGKQAAMGAILVLSDELLCDWIFNGTETPMTCEDISKYLITKDEASTERRAYEFLCDWAVSNTMHFIHDLPSGNDSCNFTNPLYGRLDTANNLYYIIPSVFRDALKLGGYNDKAALSWLRDQQLIKANGKDLTYPVQLDGQRRRCYGLYLPDTSSASTNNNALDDVSTSLDVLPF